MYCFCLKIIYEDACLGLKWTYFFGKISWTFYFAIFLREYGFKKFIHGSGLVVKILKLDNCDDFWIKFRDFKMVFTQNLGILLKNRKKTEENRWSCLRKSLESSRLFLFQHVSLKNLESNLKILIPLINSTKIAKNGFWKMFEFFSQNQAQSISRQSFTCLIGLWWILLMCFEID